MNLTCFPCFSLTFSGQSIQAPIFPLMIQTVSVIGTGLMGGSMALALRQSNPQIEVIGFDEPGVLTLALKKGSISSAAASLKEAISKADLVIVATPLSASLSLVREMAPFLKSGAIVHDLCSVKKSMSSTAVECLPKDALFVGGHPMTGSEKEGIRHADALLFENATYVLCPQERTDSQEVAYGHLKQLLTGIGARLLEMSAETHDRIAARVSHLPQLLSVLLVNLASKSRKDDHDILDLAAGGFRDMTRIAGSPFPMWRDIFSGNRTEVLEAISLFERLLSDVKLDLERDNLDGIRENFRDAEQTRDFIPTDRKGFLQPLADVYVFTSDRPGALVDMTSALFEADLSVKDIELLRIRESTGGTFRIGFQSTEEADKAVEVLSGSGFSAYRL